MPEEGLPGRSDDPSVQRALEELRLRIEKRARMDGIVVSGSRGGNDALASLLAALDQAGLIEDQTTA